MDSGRADDDQLAGGSSSATAFARSSVSRSIEDGEADALFRNHHFRISVDVRSLSNLRRAANLVRYYYQQRKYNISLSLFIYIYTSLSLFKILMHTNMYYVF